MPPSPACFKSVHSYRDELVNVGWIKIGQGAGGTVHGKTGQDIVVKVSEADAGYLAFVKFVSANASACLPRLNLIRDDQNWAVTHIERLNPLSSTGAAKVAAWWCNYMAAIKSNMALPEPVEWSTMAEALRSMAITNKWGFDMKEANAMERPDGTIVFTDPLY
ncbi:hypothetical protein AruPA_17720 [Acidiphilium sp. PA]|uniref:hypothetical protein n=1 Tax=Acidiphilium sp. PA TaxID=2871705 RepID=UPI002244CC91|nr:hypothetical protein [Acidiphilium sp. PA]MCW8308875.1 hypothetical protein [Acidiphilium sp. PA]